MPLLQEFLTENSNRKKVLKSIKTSIDIIAGGRILSVNEYCVVKY